MLDLDKHGRNLWNSAKYRVMKSVLSPWRANLIFRQISRRLVSWKFVHFPLPVISIVENCDAGSVENAQPRENFIWNICFGFSWTLGTKFFFVYFVDNGMILRVKIKRNFSINGLLISNFEKYIRIYTCTYTHVETIKSDGKNFTFT